MRVKVRRNVNGRPLAVTGEASADDLVLVVGSYRFLPDGRPSQTALSGAADHNRQWIAISRICENLDRCVMEPGLFQIISDDHSMPPCVERAPNGYGLAWETAIGEADNERRALPHHASDIREDLDRALQILNAHAAECRVEGAVGQQQKRIAVGLCQSKCTFR